MLIVHTSCSDLVMDLKLNYCHLNYFENVGGRSLFTAGNGAWKGLEIIVYQGKKFEEIMSTPRCSIRPFLTCLFLISSFLNRAYAVQVLLPGCGRYVHGCRPAARRGPALPSPTERAVPRGHREALHLRAGAGPRLPPEQAHHPQVSGRLAHWCSGAPAGDSFLFVGKGQIEA